MWATGMPDTPGCSQGRLVLLRAHRTQGPFLKCFLSGSPQWELYKGICIPEAFEITHRLKKKGKRWAWITSPQHKRVEEPGRQGGGPPKSWLLFHRWDTPPEDWAPIHCAARSPPGLFIDSANRCRSDQEPPSARQGSESWGASVTTKGQPLVKPPL